MKEKRLISLAFPFDGFSLYTTLFNATYFGFAARRLRGFFARTKG